MKYTFLIISICTCTILFGIVPINAEEQFHGYAKHDVYLKDLQYKLYKGEKISCELDTKRTECCFEESVGTICLKLNELSVKEVKKVDIYFDAIMFSDSALAKADACKEGQPFREQNDSFAWNYGFRIKGSEPTSENVFVEVTHFPVKNDMPVYSLGFSKIWKGKADGECHTITITKRDIDSFLKEYKKVAQYLAIETDLNVPVEVVLQIFSERPEDNYKNNKIVMRTNLPADNSLTWPPVTLPPNMK